MRAVTIQADKGLDDVMTEWLVNLVRAMPVGPEGLKFNGNLHNGTIVNHRAEGVWTVSFRPSPGGSNAQQYTDPDEVVQVILAGHH
jgi:hypothetical protein